MTARTLETLIRLSTAHAKARLSNRVDPKDAEAAEAILRFALFKEVVKEDRRKRRRTTAEPEAESDEEESDDDNTPAQAAPVRPARRTQRTNGAQSNGGHTDGQTNGHAHADDEEMQDTDTAATQLSWASDRNESQLDSQTQTETQIPTPAPATALTSDRYHLFETRLSSLINTPVFGDDSCTTEDLLPEVNKTLSPEELFSPREMSQALEKMTEENKIFVSGGICYKV